MCKYPIWNFPIFFSDFICCSHSIVFAYHSNSVWIREKITKENTNTMYVAYCNIVYMSNSKYVPSHPVLLSIVMLVYCVKKLKTIWNTGNVHISLNYIGGEKKTTTLDKYDAPICIDPNMMVCNTLRIWTTVLKLQSYFSFTKFAIIFAYFPLIFKNM